MPISSEAEFEPRRHRRRPYPKDVEEAARYRAATKGGNWEDYLEEAEQALRQPKEGKEFDDSELIRSGLTKITAYAYTDPQGGLLYEVRRYEHPRVPSAKQFRQRRKGENGKWFADAGLVKVPYRWKELCAAPADAVVHFTEGEKDADRLATLGLVSTTLAGQQWSPEAAKALRGRNVVIHGDNDNAGRKHVEDAVAALSGFAKSIRIVKLTGLGRTEDVSDWLDKGHTKDELLEAIAAARPDGIKAKAYGLIDPKKVKPREWLYMPDYIRQFVTTITGAGGKGKSSLAIAEVLAMVSGRDLLGVKPSAPLRVWYWNGEDPQDELERRFAAAQKFYQLQPKDIGNRLFINSGLDDPIIIAQHEDRAAEVNHHTIEQLETSVRENKIDVVVLDPFVSIHRVNENLNAEIELVIKSLTRIAKEHNAAILIVHHARKPNGGELSVDDSRGASAFIAAARASRIVNTMTDKEATDADIVVEQRGRYFSTYTGKANLAPPASARKWFKIESVNLGNEGEDGFGDNVGVVTPWDYPQMDFRATPAMVEQAMKLISEGEWRKDARTTTGKWVGIAIAQAFGLDLATGKGKKVAAHWLKDWLTCGTLIEEKRPHGPKRKPVPFVVVAPAMRPKTWKPRASSPRADEQDEI